MSLLFYLDMDGVLADFVGGAFKLFDKEYDPTTWPPDKKEIHQVLGVSSGTFWSKIYSEGSMFWSTLEPYPWAQDFYKLLKGYGGVVFCSSPPRNPSALQGKLEWLQGFSGEGELLRNYLFSPVKHLAAVPGSILIDDSEQQCQMFANVAKGLCMSILFPQPWNSLGYHEDPLSIIMDIFLQVGVTKIQPASVGDIKFVAEQSRIIH
ncbi:MAG: hypothetical protein EHM79_00195 [Geobacter sp.]|nr:MAG: hypothetical protein EHM79_00195 [Geobacter sp.]